MHYFLPVFIRKVFKKYLFNILYVLTKKQYLSFLFVISLCLSIYFSPVQAQSVVERVIIISVDSMNNDFIFNENENPDFSITPNIGSLVKNGAAFTMAEAVMPTKTQVNHVTIVSGSYADNIGIVGNYVFDPSKNSKAYMGNIEFPWKNPSLIKADTIFKAMERENPEYTSLVVAGKNYVGRPIWADYQSGPAYTSDNAEKLGVMKFPEIMLWDSPDEWVMDNALLLLDEVDPDITLINLPFLDPVQHSFGHGSMESWAALAWADYQIGRLLQYLIESAKLESTLLVVTADHGQTNTWERVNLEKILRSEELDAHVISDGAFASVFLANGEDLNEAVDVLSGLEYIDGIWYGDGFDDIHIRTPYTGDIAVSMAPPYEAFSRIRPPFMGIHGGLQQRFVPLIFFGPNVERGLLLEKASLTDIVPTICEITGFPLPLDSQGSVLPVIDRTQSQAPSVTPKFVEYPRYTVAYIPMIFLFLSVLTLIPALVLQKNYGYFAVEISPGNLSNIIPSLLMNTGVIFAIAASFYSYIVNLYAVPGIQPDSFLTAMDFGILGSFLISISLSLIILWYAPLALRFGIQKITRRPLSIKTIPFATVFLFVSQIVFTAVNLLVQIPYNIAFHVFMTFFFGGLGLSYIYRIYMVNKYVERRKRMALITTAASGVLVAFIWFYVMMFLLFPNYLYEMGIRGII